MAAHRRKQCPSLSEKKNANISHRKDKSVKIEKCDNKENINLFYGRLRSVVVITLACGCGVVNKYHVSSVFENSLHFSHLSTLEREMTFRSEMGMYYSYYKRLIETPSFIDGIHEITHDNMTEYPSVINTLERFNLLPEVVIAGLYRSYEYIMKSFGFITKECWQVERGTGLPAVTSCEGLGDPAYFYLEIVWLCAGLTASLIFLFGVYLSDSVAGGMFAVVQFFTNHGECTRVQWTPPLRESFGYPFCLLQMLLVTICLDHNRYTRNDTSPSLLHKAQNLFAVPGSYCNYLMDIIGSVLTQQFDTVQPYMTEITLLVSVETVFLISVTSWLCLMLWQFSQFVLTTQTLAVIVMFNLTVISRFSALVILTGQAIGTLHTLVAMFGNELLLSSLFTCLLMSSILIILFIDPVLDQKINFVFRGFLEIGLIFLLTFALKTRVFTAGQDSHIVNILRAKFTDYKDFHTLLYTCAAEFDFLDWNTIKNLCTSWLIPVCVLVSWFLLCLWTSYTNFKIDRPLSNLDPDVVYAALQIGAFAIMAALIMRLKLFFVPHLCIFSSQIGSKKIFKRKLPSKAHWLIFVLVLGAVCKTGIFNLNDQRSAIGEYNNVPLEELIYWIQANTPTTAVFAGTMPVTAAVLLSASRPVVNHPHYEDAKLRERTKKVYSVFSRRSATEVFNTLSSLQVNYLIIPHNWCYGGTKSGCNMIDVWDVEEPELKANPQLCVQLLVGPTLPFHRVFTNNEYTLLRLPAPYVELKGLKQYQL